MELSIGKFFSKTEPEGAKELEEAELSFSLTNDYPSEVLEASESTHRAMGRDGRRMLYSILALNIGASDVRVAQRVKAKAIEALVQRDAVYSASFDLIKRAYELCLELLAQYQTSERRETLAYLIAHDIVGYGPLSILLEDSANIEEIEINAPTQNIVIFHAKHGRCTTNLRFNSERSFRFMLNKLISSAEKELSSTTPIIDAQLQDGSRVHAQLRPFAVTGAAASIRLNGSKSMDLLNVLENATLSSDVLAYLWMAVEAEQNIIISGAPASGKTTLLLAINAFVPSYKRVITIEEDINELKFYNNFTYVVPLQASSRPSSVSLEDQVVNSLHMRPDRLIIGEIRGAEARQVFAGANLGVPFMTTMHSGSNGQELINRLSSSPMSVEPAALNMLDLSLYMVRRSETARSLDSIVEYRWHSRTEVPVDEIGRLRGDFIPLELYKNGRFDAELLKGSKVIDAWRRKNLVSSVSALKELKKRTKFIDDMLLPGNEMKVHEYIASYRDIK